MPDKTPPRIVKWEYIPARNTCDETAHGPYFKGLGVDGELIDSFFLFAFNYQEKANKITEEQLNRPLEELKLLKEVLTAALPYIDRAVYDARAHDRWDNPDDTAYLSLKKLLEMD